MPIDQVLQPNLMWQEALGEMERGEWIQALILLDSVVEEFPRFGPAQFTMGKLCEERFQEPKRAIHFYEACLQHNPGHIDAILRLVGLLIQQNRYDEARLILNSALENVGLPDSNRIRMHYGKIEEWLGRLPEALDQYQAVFRHGTEPDRWTKARQAIQRVKAKRAEFGDEAPYDG